MHCSISSWPTKNIKNKNKNKHIQNKSNKTRIRTHKLIYMRTLEQYPRNTIVLMHNILTFIVWGDGQLQSLKSPSPRPLMPIWNVELLDNLNFYWAEFKIIQSNPNTVQHPNWTSTRFTILKNFPPIKVSCILDGVKVRPHKELSLCIAWKNLYLYNFSFALGRMGGINHKNRPWMRKW